MLTTLYSNLAASGREKIGWYQKGNYVEGMEELDRGEMCLQRHEAGKAETPNGTDVPSGYAFRIWSQAAGVQNVILALPLASSLGFPTFGIG